jgi:hypothetical protein
VSFWEQIEALWNQLLDVIAALIIPDWTQLVSWIPIVLVLAVIGPILTLLVLYHLGYQIGRPRTRARYMEYPLRVPIGPDGTPARPTGRPFCERDLLIYGPKARRCDVCRDDLVLLCPRCGVGRDAAIEVCGNCGLAGRVSDRAIAIVPDAGPPAGGAAAA